MATLISLSAAPAQLRQLSGSRASSSLHIASLRCSPPGQRMRRRPLRSPTVTSSFTLAAAFEDESHRKFYEQGSGSAAPMLARLSMKKARKLAKKLAKQRASLFKLAGSVPLNGDALGGIAAELDRAYAEVSARVDELRAVEAAADSSSSSSSSGTDAEGAAVPVDEARDCGAAASLPIEVEDTDASVAVHKLRAAKAAAAEAELASSGGGRGARVCAVSVLETAPVRAGPPAKVFVCGGKCCTRRGAAEVRAAVEGSEAAQAGGVEVVSTGCLGKCKKGAVLRVKPAGGGRPELVTRVHESQVEEVLEFKLNNVPVPVAAPILS
mmetsp:Transcript_17381/g.43718  ORF Transcript_17381/g.43718 Transcript_17381/m.43718 type:complete len:325 (+) Transcript_17381:144-1118(+)|eukprot:jgi/Tetstr1/424635/TSEL_015157.t1